MRSIFVISCKNREDSVKEEVSLPKDFSQYITILGIAQGGGYPHINNTNEFKEFENSEFARD